MLLPSTHRPAPIALCCLLVTHLPPRDAHVSPDLAVRWGESDFSVPKRTSMCFRQVDIVLPIPAYAARERSDMPIMVSTAGHYPSRDVLE